MTFARAVTNRLPEKAEKLSELNSSGAWFASNYSSATTENSEFRPDDTSYKQIYFSGISGDLELIAESIELGVLDDKAFFEFAFAVKMQSGGTIVALISEVSTIQATQQTKTFAVLPQQEVPGNDALNDASWRIFRSESVLTDKGELSLPRVSLSITITPNDPADVVGFANPVLSGSLDQLLFSESSRHMAALIPSAMYVENSLTNPAGALIRFVDVALSGLDLAIKAFKNYRFFTIADGRQENLPGTLSELVWPSNAGLSEVRWLAQFSGTDAVAKFSSSLDPSDAFVLDSSVLNGGDSLRFSSNGLNDPPTNTVEVTLDLLRWQTEYGFFGINAGSVASIRESVKKVMVEPREVTISVQNAGAFTVLVETPWEQTFGASENQIGSSSSVVEEVIRLCKPLGVKVTHQLT